MKTLFASALALALFCLSASSVSFAQAAASDTGQETAATPATILASQVAEIASSSKLTVKAKQQRIASLVRRAIITATADLKDPAQALAMAVQLATAAARAAPDFTPDILGSISSIPSIASIEGALADVQSAVTAAASPDTQESSASPVNARVPTPPVASGSSAGVVVASPSH